MADLAFEDRATGALIGALIGDALAVGPHWYYNLDELRTAYGPWITGYTTPRPGHYHEGLKAGESSQAGVLLELTMRSLAERGQYDEADFCQRLDHDFFPQIDGTPNAGPGGYTSQSIRETYRLRVTLGKPWGQASGWADTTEAAERVLAIAVRDARSVGALAEHVSSNTALTQCDGVVGAMTTAYCLALGLLVQGEKLDAQITAKLMALVRIGTLPFHSVTKAGEDSVADGPERARKAGQYASPDALLGMGNIVASALDPAVCIEPAWKVAQVYGMPCAVYHQFPAAYYLAARFADDYEAAVLNAVNGGGQNQARAILTGALVGAMVGASGIPKRFIKGLDRHEERLALARRIAAQANT